MITIAMIDVECPELSFEAVNFDVGSEMKIKNDWCKGQATVSDCSLTITWLQRLQYTTNQDLCTNRFTRCY